MAQMTIRAETIPLAYLPARCDTGGDFLIPKVVLMRATYFSSFFALVALCSIPGPAQTSANKQCTVQLRSGPSPGDIALANLEFTKAEELYAKEREETGAEGDRAHVAWIRVLLDERKLDEADKAAKEWAAAAPTDPWSLQALSQVQLREGDVPAAAGTIQAAYAADPCNAWVRAEYAHILTINSMNASAKKMMDAAHALAPDDLQIEMQWLTLSTTHAAELDEFLKRSSFLTERQRDILDGLKDHFAQANTNTCRLLSPLKTTSIPYRAIQNGPNADVFWGLDVGFNGKQARMAIDTSARGLTLTQTAASTLHLSIQQAQTASVTGTSMDVAFAQVKSLKIGDLEFADCNVRIVEKIVGSADGMIGGSIFQNFLLTLDFPGHVLKLGQLPALPGVAEDHSLNFSDTEDVSTPRDRYVDPSMKDWVRPFRLGPQLLVPVSLNKGPRHLFLISTATQYDSVSSAEPHHVEQLVRNNGNGLAAGSRSTFGAHIFSVKVDRSLPSELYFSNIHVSETDGMNSIDTSKMGMNQLGIYGILGAQALHNLTLTIDYRDSLLRFDYDPKRVAHCNPGINLPDCY